MDFQASTQAEVASLREQNAVLREQNAVLNARLAAMEERECADGGSTSGSGRTRARENGIDGAHAQFVATTGHPPLPIIPDEIWCTMIITMLAAGPDGLADVASFSAVCRAARRLAHYAKNIKLETVIFGRRTGDYSVERVCRVLRGMQAWPAVGVELVFDTHASLIAFMLQVAAQGSGTWQSAVRQLTLGYTYQPEKWRPAVGTATVVGDGIDDATADTAHAAVTARMDEEDLQAVCALGKLLTPALQKLRISNSVSAKVAGAFVRTRPDLTDFDCSGNRFHFEGIGDALVTVLSETCPNLKTLRLGNRLADGFGDEAQERITNAGLQMIGERFSKLETLLLACQPQVTSSSFVRSCPALVDVTFIRCSGLEDMSGLEHVKTLHLYECNNVTDMSPLCRLHKLDLDDCQGVSDVSPLGQVHVLSLAYCEHVTDVSPLGRVHDLSLVRCEHVTDVSPLGRVHHLTLAYCENVTDVAPLGRVHTLSLEGYGGDAESLSSLGGVHTLHLSELDEPLMDVSWLTRVHTLDVEVAETVTDVSSLARVHTLSLSSATNLTDVSPLAGVHDLSLWDAESLTDVSSLGGIRKLLLHGCNNLTDVSALGRVHELNLESCGRLADVSALGGVHTLEISDCENVTDVSALDGVPNLLCSLVFADFFVSINQGRGLLFIRQEIGGH